MSPFPAVEVVIKSLGNIYLIHLFWLVSSSCWNYLCAPHCCYLCSYALGIWDESSWPTRSHNLLELLRETRGVSVYYCWFWLILQQVLFENHVLMRSCLRCFLVIDQFCLQQELRHVISFLLEDTLNMYPKVYLLIYLYSWSVDSYFNGLIECFIWFNSDNKWWKIKTPLSLNVR